MLFVLKQMYWLGVESALIQQNSWLDWASGRSRSSRELWKLRSYSSDDAYFPRSRTGWERMTVGEMALPEAAAGWGWGTDDVHGRLFPSRDLGLGVVS